MPRLILLNGPPGCGKSTLARRYVEDHPLALNLDVDRLRGLIGGWRDRPETAGLLARELALAAARTHLDAGHDVVIPQFLARPEFPERVERLAGQTGACFAELVLLDSKENALRRFAERSRAAREPEHREAAESLRGGVAELAAMYDRLLALLATRPLARIVSTVDGEPDRAYLDLLRALG